MSKLGDAIRFVETNHSLPRCEHGNVLRDGGGERLEPTCGCGRRPVAVKCPRCSADIGKPCGSVGADFYSRGAPLKRAHSERHAAAKR